MDGGLVALLLVFAGLAIWSLGQPYDSDGTIQENRRNRRRRNAYRRKHDLPYGADVPDYIPRKRGRK